ncbi:DUF6602 domain-containing protein [Lysobacter niastensis]|uniref:DUF6602 domain-containing protein n=1 Tax=Lysobacter niastensis TaxID=380629 RepID=A0ABS0B4B6_9GAMM|nr:DUF6602 domain-containing protein [Lysobacter niastensis]MBF6023441.1 hypothetical protein [Lysobacter niastensis]
MANNQELKQGDGFIRPAQDWHELEHSQVVSTDSDPFQCLVRLPGGAGAKLADLVPSSDLFVSPFTRAFSERDPQAHQQARALFDLASSFIREAGAIEVGALTKKIKSDLRFKHLDMPYIENCLKCRAAIGSFIVERMKRPPSFRLSLADSLKQREKTRIFAATFAEELDALSKRVRHIIPHAATLGTYRENLLQSLLRKNLPDRYHVATGFIHGCDRQLDVLIYDSVDYAPIFREGDLVVATPESVRAVIEVKTSLTTSELGNSLALLNEVCDCDEGTPPFFKGIFAFESADTDTLMSGVHDFYRDTSDEVEAEDLPTSISRPFQHLTALAVPGKSFISIDYLKGKDTSRYRPVAVSWESASNLRPQAALFLSMLLSYLRHDTAKRQGSWDPQALLGSDTKPVLMRPLGSASWGNYVLEDHGREIEGVPLNQQIESVQRWLSGAVWES